MKIPLLLNKIALNIDLTTKNDFLINKNGELKTSIYPDYNEQNHIKNRKTEKIKPYFFSYFIFNKYSRLFLKTLEQIQINDISSAYKLLECDEQNIKLAADILFLKALISNDREVKLKFFKKVYYNSKSFGDLFHKHNITIGIKINLFNNINFLLCSDFKGLYILLLSTLYICNNKKETINLLNDIKTYNPLLKLIKAELFLDLESYEKVINLLQNTKSFNNDSFEKIYADMLTSIAFRKMGAYNSSISILKKLRRSYKNTPEILRLEARYQLAHSFEKVGKFRLAQKELENIQSINYQYKDTKEILNSLTS